MIISSAQSVATTREELLDPQLVARLDRLDVLSRKVFAGKLPGERRSKRRGQSVEFDDYRTYVPGDDLRHIDWNVFARLDKFFLKLFREDEDLALSIVLDMSPSMRGGYVPRTASGPEEQPSKMMYACRFAMALAYIGLVNQNRVSLSLFGMPGSGQAGVTRFPSRLAPMRGRRNVERVNAYLRDALEQTLRVPTQNAMGGQADFADAIRPVASRPGTRGVLVILSDMLYPQGIEQGMSLLAASAAGGAGFDAALLQTLSPGELDPGADRELGLLGDLRLTDIESGRAAEVTISKPLLRAYKKRLDAHLERVSAAARSRAIRHRVIATSERIDDVLLGSLRQASIIGAKPLSGPSPRN